MRDSAWQFKAGDLGPSACKKERRAVLDYDLSDRVDLRFATTVSDVDNRADGVGVTLTDGSRLDADLLVGADGIHSAVRGLVFGAEHRFLRYLGFHTAAFTFTDRDIHDQVRGRFFLTDSLDRQVGLYGLRTGVVAAFTVHRTSDPTPPTDTRAAIRREYRSLDWIVPRALAHCPPGDEVYYDQVAQVELPRWSQNRVTLVGQGASLAIAGAYLLARELNRTDSVHTGLQRYERRWRPIVTHRQRVARNIAEWFVPRSRLRRKARRIALNLTRLPGADRFVAAAMVGKPVTIITDLA